MFVRFTLYLLGAALLFLGGCKQMKQTPADTKTMIKDSMYPDWSKNANIYEVNIRQYTPEGTFRAFEKHLPRLQKMGVDILWLMPVQPIGVKNRKGSLGSYYSIKDYLNVNPEYGSMDDFKHLVKSAHAKGMHVIIDWVANHSSFDNPLITEHKDWYVLDKDGNPQPPVADWSDVADLNYDKPELRKYMIDALKFWVVQTGIDGYRCDVADMVPTDFWNEARAELNNLGRPIFMLAEAEKPELQEKAFEMNYSWEFHHIMNDITKGKKNAQDLTAYFEGSVKKFPSKVYRMNFTSNHDENSWQGHEYERMGSAEAVRAMGVLSATVPGMLLIYTGQEDSLHRRLKFFDKDAIQWGHYPLGTFYQTLLTLKKENPALWNGEYGGSMQKIATQDDTHMFAFSRQKDNHAVVVVLNLSGNPSTATLQNGVKGTFHEVFTQSETAITAGMTIELPAWGYKVYSK